MKALLFTFSALFCTIAFSQEIDQHWYEFRHGTPARRVHACDELTRYYQAEASDSLRVLGEELFLYGIDQHYYPAIEQGKLTLATWLIVHGQTADGITMAKSLLPNMEERGDDRMISGASGTIAIGYIHQKDGKSAYYWASRAGQYAKQNPDPLVRVESYQALAEAYLLQNQTDKAIETYRKYINAIKPYKSYRSLSAAYAKLGDIYRLKGNLTKAANYFRLSMQNAQLSNASTTKAHAINNLAIIYFEEGDTAKSRANFEEAMAIRIKVNEPKAISESYYNMGDYYFYISSYAKAISWYTKSREYAREHNLHAEEADACFAMANLMKETGDFKGATEQLEKYISLMEKIKLSNSADDEEVAELQQRILKMETESKAKKGEFRMTAGSRFSWEWILISLLAIALIASLVFKRKSAA